MYNFLSKNGQMLAFGLGVVFIIIFLMMVVPNVGDLNFETMTDQEKYDTTLFNFGIGAAGWLARLCGLAILGFGIYHIVSNPKGAMKGIIGVLLLAGLAFMLYSMASGEADHPVIQGALDKYADSAEGREITPENLKFISASGENGSDHDWWCFCSTNCDGCYESL